MPPYTEFRVRSAIRGLESRSRSARQRLSRSLDSAVAPGPLQSSMPGRSADTGGVVVELASARAERAERRRQGTDFHAPGAEVRPFRKP